MSVMRKRVWSSRGSLFLAIILGSCGIHPASTVDKKRDPVAVDFGVVRSLQRPRDQEKRIAELEAQLDTLKVIDQDMEKRRKSSRPPTTLTPVE